MAKTTMNPFGNLSYSQKIQTYVGLPIERMKETGDVLQGKYTAAKENKSKLDIAIAQIDLDEKDEHIRGAAKERLNLLMNPFKEKGNWEDATYTIQRGATDVATNGGLLAATKSKQQELKDDAALQARVDNDKLLDTDKEFAQEEAKKNYTGVYKDEKTGAWKGGYKIVEPPDYINVGDYTDNFLKGFEADQWMGRYMKGKDGKFYKGEETGAHTADGAKIYMPTTKEATYEEVYEAARSQVLQNEEIQERLDFELKKGNITYGDKIAADADAKKAMRFELTQQGYTKTQLDKMSDQELTDTHTRETLIHNGVHGPALKHSYEQVTTKSMGDSWKFITYKNKLAAAAAGGGDENTAIVDQEYSLLNTKGYQISGLPATNAKYIKQLAAMKHDSFKREATIQAKNIEHQKWRDDHPGKQLPASMITTLAKMEASRATHDNKIRQFEKSHQEAIDRVRKDNPNLDFKAIPKKKEELTENLSELDKQAFEEAELAIESLQVLTPNQFGTVANNLFSYWGDKNKKLNNMLHNYEVSNGPSKAEVLRNTEGGFSERQQAWLDAQAAFRATPEYAQAQHEMENAIDQIEDLPSDVKDKLHALSLYKSRNQITDKLINEELARMSTENTIQYAYINLSTETNKVGTKPGSNFTRDTTYMLRTDPHSFIHIGTDGQEQILENDTIPDYNVDNIIVLGPTSDYVHGHGILFYASETLMESDGKTPTGQKKMHLFKDPSGSWKQKALSQMQKGRLIDKGVVKSEQGFQAMDDVKYKFLHEEVDKQVAYFQTLPSISPPLDGPQYNEDNIQVILGPNSLADVKRRTAQDGTIDYLVTPRKRRDKNDNPYRGPVQRYTTISNLEAALEEYGGIGASSEIYKISMSTLSKVTEAEIPYGKFRNGMSSMPRLEEDFKNEFISMANTMKLPFTITSMTRSVKGNSDVGGHENSGHLFGKGIDIRSKDAEGQKVVKWLDNNSTLIGKGPYRRVTGMDLIYQEHDVTTGMHIDLKYSKQ